MNTKPPLSIKRWIIFGLICLTSACTPPKADPAVNAFEDLLYAFKSAQLHLVWEGLSQESRSWLFEQAKLTPTVEQLNSDTLPTTVLEHFSLQPDWRFEHNWGEVRRVDLSTEQATSAWFHFRDHQRLWKVYGRLEAQQWKFDLFHASPL